MSGYGQYGGNPYADNAGGYGAQQGGYGGQQGYADSNPYTNDSQHNNAGLSAPPTNLSQQPSNYSQGSHYDNNPPAPQASQAPTVMSNQDFLARVEGAKSDIRDLTANISSIGTIHQRVLSSPDSGASAQLENLVTQTQVLNTKIKDTVKYLEYDAARSSGNRTKDSQINMLKGAFKKQLEEYKKEEQMYEARYREQIARQYRIVNPEASEEEVREAANANWGDEGVFQTALKTNRSGTASSVLGAVRARHHDIQNIEKTLIELNQLFVDLAEAVLIQEPAIQAAEEGTAGVVKDSEAANTQLTKGIDHARRARKLKWWCFGICVLIIAILALVLGIGFGTGNFQGSNNNNGN
ncbi:t-SNARE [Aulographum hederae CBS 113979]|uniref:t-SNARE n=1 Tax=Aulographum hederae CBS 113979 TaxID=1176131 RepID=A0A6G1GLL5_9PEZI|nr:t-SNARE [Aulographum hederae CBS 113979]